ncbi:MAG: sodium-dependent transporter [candidate division WOR-3 bacterium]
MTPLRKREHWGSSLGVILAMAGNAVGLGNFLRFPVQAAKNGGGAFMIPYFISFLLIGLPLMWVEWTIGKRAGLLGHSSTPGAYESIWRSPIAKYLGIMGILFPLIIVTYYIYIESWCLGYSILSVVGQLPKMPALVDTGVAQVLKPFADFLSGYQQSRILAGGNIIVPSVACYFFFIITLALNVWILSLGIKKGIEILAKIAMPVLFLMAAALVVRVFTLGAPVHPDQTSLAGMAFLWEPQWEALLRPSVWLAAAGQIFFTLSLGFGAIITYASYLKEDEDIALNGLATASANEFAEVILGGSIAIPAAVVFFGIAGARDIAAGGAFNLGFITMPAIFSSIPYGNIFSALWFGLLFLAGITSSVALSQPIIAFLEDEFAWSKLRAALTLGIFLLIFTHIPIMLRGALDEMDFWAGTFGLVLGAAVEVILLMWIFGSDRAWEELHQNALIRVPRLFMYITKFVTPVILLIILAAWTVMDIIAPAVKTMATQGFIGWLNGFIGSGIGVWTGRLFMVAVAVLFAIMINSAWRGRRSQNNGGAS